MDESTQYRTTDLYFFSEENLTALAAALHSWARPVCLGPNPRTQREEWYCNFSIDGEGAEEPEPGIAAMLTVIESLDPLSRSTWAGCSERVFDIAYDCGRKPFAFRQELSADTLGRLAAVGASLRFTLYSDPETSHADPDAADGGA